MRRGVMTAPRSNRAGVHRIGKKIGKQKKNAEFVPSLVKHTDTVVLLIQKVLKVAILFFPKKNYAKKKIKKLILF